VSQVSVNDVWSAIRFRPPEKVGKETGTAPSWAGYGDHKTALPPASAQSGRPYSLMLLHEKGSCAMTVFLFWNINRKPLQAVVASLARRHAPDVILLTECGSAPNVTLTALNQPGCSEYSYAPGIGCRKVDVFTRFPARFIRPVLEEERLTVRHLSLPGLTDILLAVAHFPAKTHWKEASQALEATHLSRSVTRAELQVGHSRTVLVADLNMNPFEPGVAGASGLHGVMTRRIAEKRERTVQGRRFAFFYNPMWSLHGDQSPGPPGTYYYSRSEQVEFFWNMFDQVLIRPDLLEFFSNDDLRILDCDGTRSLLTQEGVPDARHASDHLPLLFTLRL